MALTNPLQKMTKVDTVKPEGWDVPDEFKSWLVNTIDIINQNYELIDSYFAALAT